MAFVETNHILLAVHLFGLAAVPCLLGHTTGAVAPLTPGALVAGVAWVALPDGGSGEDVGKEEGTP